MQVRISSNTQQYLSIRDWIVFSLCVCSGIFLFRLVMNSQIWYSAFSNRGGGFMIGNVFKDLGNTRHRLPHSILWEDFIGQINPVVSGEAIFTGESAKAIVRLDGGDFLTLLPNTMVVVRTSSEKQSQEKYLLGVKEGAAQLKVSKEPTILIQVNAQAFRVKTDEAAVEPQVRVSFDKSPDQTGIRFETDSEKEIVLTDVKVPRQEPLKFNKAKNLVALKSGGTVLTPPLHDSLDTDVIPTLIQQRPANGSTLYLGSSKTQLVLFQTTPIPTGFEGEFELLEGGKSVQSISLAAGKTLTELNLGPGTYQWRIRAKAPGGKTSDWSTLYDLKVLLGSQEDLFAPSSKFRELARVAWNTLAVKPTELSYLSARLKWDALPEADGYQVAVYRKDGSELLSKKVHETYLDIQVDSIDDLELSYEVTALLSSGEKVQSKRQQFAFELSPPRLTRSDIRKHSLEKTLYLTWARTRLATEYEVQVAQDSEFSEILLSDKRKINVLPVRLEKAGTYYWRVAAIYSGKRSAWSEGGRFELK